MRIRPLERHVEEVDPRTGIRPYRAPKEKREPIGKKFLEALETAADETRGTILITPARDVRNLGEE